VITGRSVELPLKGKTGMFLLHEVIALAPAFDAVRPTDDE
jgi:hypothetical protein